MSAHMPRRTAPVAPRRPGSGGRVLMAAIIASCVLVEGIASASSLGLLPGGLRRLIYGYGAFWPGLFADWTANFAGQQVTMFFTYAFLHGGLVHLALNMVTLWSLGMALLDRYGMGAFAMIYGVSMIAGAGTYAVLTTSGLPMVGASGALFGLAGALLATLWSDQPTLRDAIKLAGRGVLLLIALNVAMYFALGGRLAWETHLGGFLGGWVAGIAVHRPMRPGHSR